MRINPARDMTEYLKGIGAVRDANASAGSQEGIRPSGVQTHSAHESTEIEIGWLAFAVLALAMLFGFRDAWGATLPEGQMVSVARSGSGTMSIESKADVRGWSSGTGVGRTNGSSIGPSKFALCFGDAPVNPAVVTAGMAERAYPTYGTLAALWLVLMAHALLLHWGLDRRLTAVEMGTMECYLEAASQSRDPVPSGTRSFVDGESSVSADQERPARKGGQAKPLSSPAQTIRYIVALAERVTWITRKASVPEGRWSVGMASVAGPVRTSNQDFVQAFRVGDDTTVVAISDGLGGLPHGERSARWATIRAAVAALGLTGREANGGKPSPVDVARGAMTVASRRVAEEAAALGLEGPRAGFRTTLIVAVITHDEVGYSYIGDGGLAILRRTGVVEQLLEPQKAGGAPNVLSASLGPAMEGSPVSGTARREAGDLVLAGTDGVWDRVGAEFPRDVLRACIERDGDLQGVAEDVLAEMATFRDAAGPVCDDNMTLVLVGDGTRPNLQPGFWDGPSTEPSDGAAEIQTGPGLAS